MIGATCFAIVISLVVPFVGISVVELGFDPTVGASEAMSAGEVEDYVDVEPIGVVEMARIVVGRIDQKHHFLAL